MQLVTNRTRLAYSRCLLMSERGFPTSSIPLLTNSQQALTVTEYTSLVLLVLPGAEKIWHGQLSGEGSAENVLDRPSFL